MMKHFVNGLVAAALACLAVLVWTQPSHAQFTTSPPVSVPVTVVGGPTPPPTPAAIAFSHTAASISDMAAAGTLVTDVVVTMSDGTSPYTGALALSNETLNGGPCSCGFYAVQGMTIVTARQLTSADDGSHAVLVTAN